MDDHGTRQSVIKAIGHPMRRQVLLAMREHARPSSPRTLAEQLELSLSDVSYHVRVLADCDVIRLVDTKPVRGTLAHFYEATELIDDPLVVAAIGPRGNEGSHVPPSEA